VYHIFWYLTCISFVYIIISLYHYISWTFYIHNIHYEYLDLHHSQKNWTELQRVAHGDKSNYRNKIFSLPINCRLHVKLRQRRQLVVKIRRCGPERFLNMSTFWWRTTKHLWKCIRRIGSRELCKLTRTITSRKFWSRIVARFVAIYRIKRPDLRVLCDSRAVCITAS